MVESASSWLNLEVKELNWVPVESFPHSMLSSKLFPSFCDEIGKLRVSFAWIRILHLLSPTIPPVVVDVYILLDYFSHLSLQMVKTNAKAKTTSMAQNLIPPVTVLIFANQRL